MPSARELRETADSLRRIIELTAGLREDSQADAAFRECLELAAEVLSAAGKSLNAIARALNDEGIPTAKDGQWFASTVSHVVRSVGLDEELGKIRSTSHQ